VKCEAYLTGAENIFEIWECVIIYCFAAYKKQLLIEVGFCLVGGSFQ